MSADWHPIATAPRDGTEVELTWMEDGQPQEVWRMGWTGVMWTWRSAFGTVLATWCENDPTCAPTHWRLCP